MNTFKAFLFVTFPAVVIMTCFSMNVVKSAKQVRQPAIEVTKQYHFNKNLLSMLK